jgi:hypothetical protein
MPLQTLRTPDPDELAEGFRRWDLRFRQLGGGSFRGELQFLQLGATQILGASGNRRLQAQARFEFGDAAFQRRNPPVAFQTPGTSYRRHDVIMGTRQAGSCAPEPGERLQIKKQR